MSPIRKLKRYIHEAYNNNNKYCICFFIAYGTQVGENRWRSIRSSNKQKTTCYNNNIKITIGNPQRAKFVGAKRSFRQRLMVDEHDE